jgi:hypothetical protein
MHCAHCLRGQAENKDLSPEYLHQLLDQTDSIGSLAFTGGEPTLNLPIIAETLRYCKKHKIPVYDFYLVTNGKKITSQFLTLMIKWYAYCLECGGASECSGVALSKDIYHEPINRHNEMMLQGLGFYRPEDKSRDYTKYPPLNLGNARQLAQTNEPLRLEEIDAEKEGDTIRIIDTTVTLTAEGDLLSECDYEYSDPYSVWICNVKDAASTFNKICSDPDFNWHNQTRKVAN